MKIRKDDRGLYIQSRFWSDNPEGHYRPGAVPGYDYAVDMDHGNLNEGDNPKTHHCAGVPLVKITLANGRVLHWAATYEHDRWKA